MTAHGTSTSWRPTSARPVRLVAALVALAMVATACGTDDDGDLDDETTTTTEPTTTTTADDDTTTTTDATDDTDDAVALTEVRAYLVRDEAVAPVARAAEGQETGAAAMEGLLAGPTDEEEALGFGTAVPEGTELLALDIAEGIATVDLSTEFTDTAGSATVQAQVAQVVFTLTQFPTVDAVVFWVDGEPLDVLAGEGLMLDEPQTRYDWEDLAPAILVESPLPFAEEELPLRIVGSAATFEATFQIRVVVDDEVVYDDFATATDRPDGRPEAIFRNDFDVTIDLEPAQSGPATLVLYELSARDGSEINTVELPITLAD